MTILIIITFLVFLAFTYLHVSNTVNLKNYLRSNYSRLYKELNFDHPLLFYKPFIGMKKAKEFIFKNQHQELNDPIINALTSKIRIGTLLSNLSIIMVIILAIIDAIKIS